MRIFVSYEYCLNCEKAFWNDFEKMLQLADKYNIRVMPVLFENCGNPFTMENALDKNPATAACVQSPGHLITTGDPKGWAQCAEFVRAFMRKYANDNRLIAIEIMNEPHGGTGDISFARHMTYVAKELQGVVPLTIGCGQLEECLYFESMLDILQFHDNFPRNLEELNHKLKEAVHLQNILGKPVWLSEWQRVRANGPGWDVEALAYEETLPNLTSMAKTVYASGIGNFFWNLMVKPAYLPSQRLNGTYNGLFHEDGSVYSAQDFQAIAECNEYNVIVNSNMPQWYLASLKEY